MLLSILYALITCLTVLGGVTIVYLVLLRILRPRHDMYGVVCYLFAGRLDVTSRLSFARERLRLFGESRRCKIIAVLCEFTEDEEHAIRAAFVGSTDIIFTHEDELPQVLALLKEDAVKII